jgi:hypothetical protein
MCRGAKKEDIGKLVFTVNIGGRQAYRSAARCPTVDA